jgi:RND family efflux transporter MFP subunit
MRLLSISALCVAAVVSAGCSKQAKDSQVEAASKGAEPIAVRVIPAETRKIEKAISVTGGLFPDETVTVTSEVAGRLSALHVDFGQWVKKGDVIAELDKQELSLQVERSRAALAQALARIGLDPKDEEATPKSTPAIRQAEAQMEDARSKYESAAKLVKSGDIAQERFTEVEKTLHARQAALEAARDELRTLLASVQALRTEVRLAEKRLNDATVIAPFNGSVSEKPVSPGQYLKENTPIVTLVKTNPMRLRVDIPEAAAGSVRVGTSLTFTTDAVPDVVFQAIVRELNPSLDAKSRSLTAEARLAQTDQRLRPGMFVQVRLVTAREALVVAVPKQALYSIAGLTKVFVVRDGKVAEHKIPPGAEVNGWVEVPGDMIRAGEAVAVSNLAALTPGLPVKSTGPKG